MIGRALASGVKLQRGVWLWNEETTRVQRLFYHFDFWGRGFRKWSLLSWVECCLACLCFPPASGTIRQSIDSVRKIGKVFLNLAPLT